MGESYRILRMPDRYVKPRMQSLANSGKPVDRDEALAAFRNVWGSGSDRELLIELALYRLSCSEANALADVFTAMGDDDSAGVLLWHHCVRMGEDSVDVIEGGHRHDPRIDWEEIREGRDILFGP